LLIVTGYPVPKSVADKYIPLFEVTQIDDPLITVVGLVGKEIGNGSVMFIADSSPGEYPTLVDVFVANCVNPDAPNMFAVRLFDMP
jgi:hypothetical protein